MGIARCTGPFLSLLFMSHLSALPPRHSPSPRHSVRPVWGAFGLDLLIVFVGFITINFIWVVLWGMARTVVLTIQSGSAPTLNQLGEMGILGQMLLTIISIGLPTLLLCLWRHRPTQAQWRASFEAILRPEAGGWVLLIACSCLAFSMRMTELGEKIGISADPSNVQSIQQGWASYPFVTLMMVAVLAPIYEELLFRRILFRRLWKAGYPVLGMVLSGFLFAFVHEIPGITGNGLLATLLFWFVYTNMGIAFAWLYQHTGTLYAAIAAHAINNAIALAMLILFGAS